MALSIQKFVPQKKLLVVPQPLQGSDLSPPDFFAIPEIGICVMYA